MIIEQKQLTGTVTPMYYVDVTLLDTLSNSITVQLQVDTGADLSYIPEIALESLTLPVGNKYLVRYADGKIRTIWSKLVTFLIDDRFYRPKRGVGITREEVGFLGLDVLNEMDMLICGNVMLLEKQGGK